MNKLIPTEIDEIAEAIDNLPFQNWPTRELQAVPLTILDAMREEYDTFERLKLLIEAQGILQRHVTQTYKAVYDRLSSITQNVEYYTMGTITLIGEMQPIPTLKAVASKLEEVHIELTRK